jgi:hypothetical protein
MTRARPPPHAAYPDTGGNVKGTTVRRTLIMLACLLAVCTVPASATPPPSGKYDTAAPGTITQGYTFGDMPDTVQGMPASKAAAKYGGSYKGTAGAPASSGVTPAAVTLKAMWAGCMPYTRWIERNNGAWVQWKIWNHIHFCGNGVIMLSQNGYTDVYTGALWGANNIIWNGIWWYQPYSTRELSRAHFYYKPGFYNDYPNPCLELWGSMAIYYCENRG